MSNESEVLNQEIKLYILSRSTPDGTKFTKKNLIF